MCNLVEIWLSKKFSTLYLQPGWRYIRKSNLNEIKECDHCLLSPFELDDDTAVGIGDDNPYPRIISTFGTSLFPLALNRLYLSLRLRISGTLTGEWCPFILGDDNPYLRMISIFDKCLLPLQPNRLHLSHRLFLSLWAQTHETDTESIHKYLLIGKGK